MLSNLVLITLTLLNIIRTAPSEPHTYALVSYKECANNQYSKCSCMSEYTTNLIKTLAGRFFRMYSDRKTLRY